MIEKSFAKTDRPIKYIYKVKFFYTYLFFMLFCSLSLFLLCLFFTVFFAVCLFFWSSFFFRICVFDYVTVSVCDIFSYIPSYFYSLLYFDIIIFFYLNTQKEIMCIILGCIYVLHTHTKQKSAFELGQIAVSYLRIFLNKKLKLFLHTTTTKTDPPNRIYINIYI